MPAAPITRFAGPYAFLSNFYPVRVSYQGEWYPTVEHAFQAAKTDSPAERRRVQAARTPGIAKHLGRRVTLRDDWEHDDAAEGLPVRVVVMRGLLVHKFSYPLLRRALLQTGDAPLVEGNTWGDRYWGQCPIGTGENRLGQLLMQVREEIRG